MDRQKRLGLGRASKKEGHLPSASNISPSRSKHSHHPQSARAQQTKVKTFREQRLGHVLRTKIVSEEVESLGTRSAISGQFFPNDEGRYQVLDTENFGEGQMANTTSTPQLAEQKYQGWQEERKDEQSSPCKCNRASPSDFLHAPTDYFIPNDEAELPGVNITQRNNERRQKNLERAQERIQLQKQQSLNPYQIQGGNKDSNDFVLSQEISHKKEQQIEYSMSNKDRQTFLLQAGKSSSNQAQPIATNLQHLHQSNMNTESEIPETMDFNATFHRPMTERIDGPEGLDLSSKNPEYFPMATNNNSIYNGSNESPSKKGTQRVLIGMGPRLRQRQKTMPDAERLLPSAQDKFMGSFTPRSENERSSQKDLDARALRMKGLAQEQTAFGNMHHIEEELNEVMETTEGNQAGNMLASINLNAYLKRKLNAEDEEAHLISMDSPPEKKKRGRINQPIESTYIKSNKLPSKGLKGPAGLAAQPQTGVGRLASQKVYNLEQLQKENEMKQKSLQETLLQKMGKTPSALTKPGFDPTLNEQPQIEIVDVDPQTGSFVDIEIVRTQRRSTNVELQSYKELEEQLRNVSPERKISPIQSHGKFNSGGVRNLSKPDPQSVYTKQGPRGKVGTSSKRGNHKPVVGHGSFSSSQSNHGRSFFQSDRSDGSSKSFTSSRIHRLKKEGRLNLIEQKNQYFKRKGSQHSSSTFKNLGMKIRTGGDQDRQSEQANFGQIHNVGGASHGQFGFSQNVNVNFQFNIQPIGVGAQHLDLTSSKTPEIRQSHQSSQRGLRHESNLHFQTEKNSNANSIKKIRTQIEKNSQKAGMNSPNQSDQALHLQSLVTSTLGLLGTLQQYQNTTNDGNKTAREFGQKGSPIRLDPQTKRKLLEKERQHKQNPKTLSRLDIVSQKSGKAPGKATPVPVSGSPTRQLSPKKKQVFKAAKHSVPTSNQIKPFVAKKPTSKPDLGAKSYLIQRPLTSLQKSQTRHPIRHVPKVAQIQLSEVPSQVMSSSGTSPKYVQQTGDSKPSSVSNSMVLKPRKPVSRRTSIGIVSQSHNISSRPLKDKSIDHSEQQKSFTRLSRTRNLPEQLPLSQSQQFANSSSRSEAHFEKKFSYKPKFFRKKSPESGLKVGSQHCIGDTVESIDNNTNDVVSHRSLKSQEAKMNLLKKYHVIPETKIINIQDDLSQQNTTQPRISHSPIPGMSNLRPVNISNFDELNSSISQSHRNTNSQMLFTQENIPMTSLSNTNANISRNQVGDQATEEIMHFDDTPSAQNQPCFQESPITSKGKPISFNPSPTRGPSPPKKPKIVPKSTAKATTKKSQQLLHSSRLMGGRPYAPALNTKASVKTMRSGLSGTTSQLKKGETITSARESVKSPGLPSKTNFTRFNKK